MNDPETSPLVTSVLSHGTVPDGQDDLCVSQESFVFVCPDGTFDTNINLFFTSSVERAHFLGFVHSSTDRHQGGGCLFGKETGSQGR